MKNKEYMKIHTLILGLSVILAACQPQPKTVDHNATKGQEIPILDFEATIEKSIPDTFLWNSVAKSSTFIPLSSSSHLMDAHLSINYLDDDLLIISEGKEQWINCLDFEGKQLKSFRHIGNGPGEYQYLTSVVYHPKDSTIRVFDNGNKKYIVYNKQGKLLREQSLIASGLGRLMYTAGDKYFCAGDFSHGKAEIIMTDTLLNVQKLILPFDSVADFITKGATMLQAAQSNVSHDRYLYNHLDNDSVFLLTPDGLELSFILKKGKYAPPLEQIAQFMRWRKDAPWIKGLSIHAFGDFYYIHYFYNGRSLGEIWSRSARQLLSRSVMTRPDMFSSMRGVQYRFPSGNLIKLVPAYIDSKRIAFIIPADEAMNEIPGTKIKEDDNPVILVLEL